MKNVQHQRKRMSLEQEPRNILDPRKKIKLQYHINIDGGTN